MNTEAASDGGLWGTYGGVVEKVNDPEQLGRVKVRVPFVYGATPSVTGYVGTNDLPWAMPAGMPAGGSKQSGGFSHLPESGDHVLVRFLDGEPEKPVWEWGMQTITDAKGLQLHQYSMSGKTVAGPKRAAWTRYGHTVELNPDGVIATTSQGYRLVLTDADPGDQNGLITVATAKGNMLEIDDDSDTWTIYATEDVNLNIGDTLSLLARSIDFTLTDSAFVDIGTSLNVSAEDVTVEATGLLQLNFETMKMGLGSEPFVLGSQLTAFLESLLLWLTTHTHGNGNLGSPTTPPLIPPEGVVQPEVTALISETIFGE